MGKTGKSYSGAGGQPFSFQGPEDHSVEERAMGRELLAAVAGLICVLAILGWAFTLVS
jgi:hypothetical protein